MTPHLVAVTASAEFSFHYPLTLPPPSLTRAQAAQVPLVLSTVQDLPGGELWVQGHCPYGTFTGAVAPGLVKFL